MTFTDQGKANNFFMKFFNRLTCLKVTDCLNIALADEPGDILCVYTGTEFLMPFDTFK